MTDSEAQPAARFRRAPRAQQSPAPHSRANFLESVDAIEAFLGHATRGGRSAFQRTSPPYASGSMAIIRAAALFETDEFAPFVRDTPAEVVAALRTMRSIASHAGSRAMNDDLFWVTLTSELPPHITEWRRAGEESESD
ncbi:antitoxin [Microbacterium testaceum]|uniref:antitoxin n=1 Tax=Microbacterium testaceum TaxID=2033 RepID=UPI00124422F3|nr:antitoxin [Microbacterium testaceum]